MDEDELRRLVAHHLAHARMYAAALAEHLRLARQAIEEEKEVEAHRAQEQRNELRRKSASDADGTAEGPTGRPPSDSR